MVFNNLFLLTGETSTDFKARDLSNIKAYCLQHLMFPDFLDGTFMKK